MKKMNRNIYTLIFAFIVCVFSVNAQESDILEFTVEKFDTKSEVFDFSKDEGQDIGYRSSDVSRSHAYSSEAGSTAGSLSVSLSGGANYSIPIVLPSGVKDVVPQVGISHSSQGGNGLVGWGWNITGLSTISRVPSTKYHDGKHDGVDFKNDRYSLDGQRLILKSGVYGKSGSVYETENRSNIKVVAHGSSPYGASYGPKYFVVFYPNGAMAWYGSGGNSVSRLEWAIHKWKDPQEVPVHYFYQNDNGLLSIKTIRYGGKTGKVSHMNRINFTYKKRRRPELMYIGGFGFKRTHLLQDIRVISSGRQYRKYILNHNSNSLKYDRLTSVQEFNAKNKGLRPIYFNYGHTKSGLKKLTKTKFYPGLDYKNSSLIAGNFDYDGKTDIIVFDKNKKNEIALVNELFNSSTYAGQPTAYAPTRLKFKSPFTAIFPVSYRNDSNNVSNQQGFTVVKESRKKVYFQTLAFLSGRILQQNVKLWDTAPTYSSESNCREGKNIYSVPKQYISGDFDGDGLTDVIAITKEYSIDVCDEEENDECNCHATKTVKTSTAFHINLDPQKKSNYVSRIGNFISSIGSKDRITTVDFNGDGRIDIAHFKQGWVYIYTLDNKNRLKLLHKEKNAKIDLKKDILNGDFNGDGKTDFAVPLAYGSSNWMFFTSRGNSYGKYTKNIGVLYEKTEVINYFTKRIRYWRPFWWRWKTIKIPTLFEHKYVPQDINSDGKVDIIKHTVATALENYRRNIERITTYENVGSVSHSAPDFISKQIYNKVNTAVGKYGVPLVLEASHRNHNPEYVYLKANYAYAYELSKDNKKEMLLSSINNNGITTKIETQRLGFPKREERSVYRSSSSSKYPYFDIEKSNQFNIVKRIIETGAGVRRSQDFSYKNAISHLNLGFLGFQQTVRSNWYGSGVSRLYTVTKHNPKLRGAITDQWVSTSAYPSSNYISKTTNTYSKHLSPKKVWTLLPTKIVERNGLTNSTSTKSYLYDAFKNPTQEVFTFKGGSKRSTYAYSNNISANNDSYHVGRITRKVETSTIGGSSFTTEESYRYRNNLLIEQKVKGSGTPWNTETFKYDVFGNVVQKTLSASGVASRTESFKYDSSGRFLTESTDIEGLKTKFTYDTFGNPLTTTNPYNQRTTFTYDGWNRLKTERNYLGHTSVFSYTRLGNGGLRKTSNYPQGSDEVLDYNALGWVTRSSKLGLNNKWIRKSFQHDVAGRVIKESEPYFSSPSQWNTVAYDLYGREVARRNFNGLVARISYSGLTVTVNDGTKTVRTTKDGSGNIVRVQDPGGIVNYTYHGNGTMKTANYASHVVKTEIDGWGRKTKLIDPSAGTYTYSYNNLGELLRETTPKGATNYTYDRFGKITTKKLGGENTGMSMSYSYDGKTKLLKSIRGANSRTKESYTYQYTYDTHKRPYITKETNGKAYFEHRISRDGYGRVASERYISKSRTNNVATNIAIKNVYDASGILKEIRDASNKTLWRIKDVNARGQAKEVHLGNGFIKKKNYNSYGFLTKILDQKDRKVTSLHLDYQFDSRRGNLLKRKNNNLSWAENFTYDNLDRLTNITGAVSRKQQYDNRGRITQNTDIGGYVYKSATSYHLKEVDLNTQGDLHFQNNPLQKISYNAFKKPVTISSNKNGKVDFEYSILQNRSHAYYGGDNGNKLKRRYQKHYSAITPVEIEQDKQGNTKIITYIGGDAYTAPIAYIHQTKSGTSKGYHYLHRDYLGSILAITDSKGKVREQRQFGAWGEVDKFNTVGREIDFEHDSTLINRGYTGHEHFVEVGLIHMNGRMYDAKLGRFLSPDNYVQEPFSTQSFNRFGYVWNNPLKFTDPSGEFFWVVVAYAAFVGAATGAATYAISAAISGDWSWKDFGMSILGGALTGALAGAIAPGVIISSALSNSLAANIFAGTLAGFIPGVKIPMGDFSLNLSPSIAFGKAFGIGANVGLSYNKGSFSISAGIGFTYFGSAQGTGHKGWEYRFSGAIGYSDGNFHASLYSTYFKSGKTSQQVGGLSLGHGDWNLRYENDGAPFPKLISGQTDKYRTAAMSLSYKDYSIGFNLFTGDPEKAGSNELPSTESVSGHPNRINRKGKLEQGGQYNGGTANKYRLGAAYIGYKGYRFGKNSEGIRHTIQNKVAHTAISYQPWFKVLNTQPAGYFQYQSYNPYTLW